MRSPINPRGSFKTQCAQAGFCCRYGYLAIEDAKAGRTSDGRIKAESIVTKFGFLRDSAFKIIQNFGKGQYACEKADNCLMVKMGLRPEELPSLSESRSRFLALRGTRVDAFQTAQVGPQRVGPPAPGVIIGMARTDWLWVTVAFEKADPTLKLGDQMWIENLFWGTIIDIDGPNITLLLPGDKHGQRNKYILDRK